MPVARQRRTPRYNVTPAMIRSLIKDAAAKGKDLEMITIGMRQRDINKLVDLGFEVTEDNTLLLATEDFAEVKREVGKVGLAKEWTDADKEAFDQVSEIIQELQDEDEDDDEDGDEDGDEDEDYGAINRNRDVEEDDDEDEGSTTPAVDPNFTVVALADSPEFMQLSQENAYLRSQLDGVVQSTRQEKMTAAIDAAKKRGVNAEFLNFATASLKATSNTYGEPILKLHATGAKLDNFDVLLKMLNLATGVVPTEGVSDSGMLLSALEGEEGAEDAADKYALAVKNLLS